MKELTPAGYASYDAYLDDNPDDIVAMPDPEGTQMVYVEGIGRMYAYQAFDRLVDLCNIVCDNGLGNTDINTLRVTQAHLSAIVDWQGVQK